MRERSWFKVIQKIFRVFQNPHVIYATFTADRIFVRWIDNSFVEQVDDPANDKLLNYRKFASGMSFVIIE